MACLQRPNSPDAIPWQWPWPWRENKNPPKWLHIRSSKWFILWVCSFSVFADIFLYALIVPVIPFALSYRVGLDPSDAQKWTSILLTIYAGGLLVGSPLCGWWADKTKARQVPFIVGLLLLAGATVMFALARNLALLVVARILQGLSGAVVWTIALAMMADRVGSQEIGAHLGTIVAARSIATISAPLIGGIVYAKVGYYMVYVTAFIFLGADIVFRLVMIEARVAQKWDPSIGLQLAREHFSTQKLEGPEKVSQKEDEARAFTVAQPRGSRISRLVHYLPPFITVLSSIRLVMALWGCTVLAILFGAFEATIPLFVHSTFHWDSAGAGLVFLAVLIPTFISPAIGWLADKHGTRWYVAIGYLLTTIPVILLRIVTQNTLYNKIVFCVLLAFSGGLAMLFEVPVQIEIVLSVEEKMRENAAHYGEQGAYAQAFGLGNLTYALGLIIGPLWSGYAVEGAGWGVVTLTLGIMCCVSAVPAAIWTEGNIFKRKKKPNSGREGEGERQEVSASVGTASASDSHDTAQNRPEPDSIIVPPSAV
ncbi:MFS multidrug transporter [Blastomyces gilchristii SLH14081]|uniref:MFS multidrug transporter n=1 Tax=Blastomyces gilchristii (strain SLH14081) TaxID=559298 RepID=A0A179UJ04_BLAGS|nr:MFS multidrug transporter [Blastomyces gilchristii SLH14081]OAT08046.1 MFS multidrug transporter [Blastomyces gilchristii SLH14081]